MYHRAGNEIKINLIQLLMIGFFIFPLFFIKHNKISEDVSMLFIVLFHMAKAPFDPAYVFRINVIDRCSFLIHRIKYFAYIFD